VKEPLIWVQGTVCPSIKSLKVAERLQVVRYLLYILLDAVAILLSWWRRARRRELDWVGALVVPELTELSEMRGLIVCEGPPKQDSIGLRMSHP
jgi:hypothetical protein